MSRWAVASSGVVSSTAALWQRLGGTSRQFAGFVTVGGGGVLVNNAGFWLLHARAALPLAVCSAVATEVAIVHNFCWNNYLTFRARGWSWQRLGRFNLSCLGGLVITVTAVAVGTGWLHVHYLAANLVGIALGSVWNFWLSRCCVWLCVPAPAPAGAMVTTSAYEGAGRSSR
jgi:dolichol-phosphate mannosyltransferase